MLKNIPTTSFLDQAQERLKVAIDEHWPGHADYKIAEFDRSGRNENHHDVIGQFDHVPITQDEDGQSLARDGTFSKLKER